MDRVHAHDIYGKTDQRWPSTRWCACRVPSAHSAVEALEAIGGFDVGGGEDLDITLRLRARGGALPRSGGDLGYTEVPVQSWTLLR